MLKNNAIIETPNLHWDMKSLHFCETSITSNPKLDQKHNQNEKEWK
jgi:hypothetical protein